MGKRTSLEDLLSSCMSCLFLPQLSVTIKREERKKERKKERKNRKRNIDRKKENGNDRKDDKIQNTRKYGKA
jgi:hypothetical protein